MGKLFDPDILPVRIKNKKKCLDNILKNVVNKTSPNVLISKVIDKYIKFNFNLV